MSVPHGEGVAQQPEVDAALHIPDPKFHLIEPTAAPEAMLDRVRVNTEARCLEAATSVGTVAVELYWSPEANAAQETRGDFFSPLPPELDPNAATNPLPTQKYPYTILPDGSLYQVVVRAPAEVTTAEWSEPRQKPITHPGKFTLLDGMDLATFRRMFPGVEVDLPAGRYNITATEQSKPTLTVAARVENGEPLARQQEIAGSTPHYREILAGDFLRSGLRPDTTVAIIDSRTTMYRGKDTADNQRLVFKAHDGFQRTDEGAAEHSGLVELIVMQGEAVQYSDFTFTPFRPLPFGQSSSSSTLKNQFRPSLRRDNFPGTKPTFDGLSGGETRYRPPETVKVHVGRIRELRAIAAFRFALTGMPGQLS